MAGVVTVGVEEVEVLVVVVVVLDVVVVVVVVVLEVVVVEVVLVLPHAETRRITTMRIAKGINAFFISAPFNNYLWARFVPLIIILFLKKENSGE
jgi:hypothetical protein